MSIVMWGGTAIFRVFFVIAPLISITESQMRHQIKLESPGFKTKKNHPSTPHRGGVMGGSKRHIKKKIGFAWGDTAMLTLRSNNSKSINPISKYFTDLKISDKSALIKHSHTSLRPLILLLIIVCKIVFWVGMIKSSSNAPYIQRKSFLILYIHGLMPCYDWLYVSVSVCMSLKRNLIKIYVMLT